MSSQSNGSGKKIVPRCIVIAGPNGSGKTTFATEFLPSYAKVVRFVNADLIAGGCRRYGPNWRQLRLGVYRIEIIYLTLPSAGIALRRIAKRVKQGGHDIPRADVVRRFQRSRDNFERIYKSIADAWMVYDNSGDRPVRINEGP